MTGHWTAEWHDLDGRYAPEWEPLPHLAEVVADPRNPAQIKHARWCAENAELLARESEAVLRMFRGEKL